VGGSDVVRTEVVGAWLQPMVVKKHKSIITAMMRDMVGILT
jgi:hypothetical protein